LINSSIAKAAIGFFFPFFLSTFGENDGHLTKPPGLSLKNNFYNEISSAVPTDLYSKQAPIS